MPKRALVLIDVQNDYFPGGKWPLSGIESAADNAAKLLAAARAAGTIARCGYRGDYTEVTSVFEMLRPAQ
jgi:hypothetical protein